jgi:hypothetical protein
LFYNQNFKDTETDTEPSDDEPSPDYELPPSKKEKKTLAKPPKGGRPKKHRKERSSIGSTVLPFLTSHLEGIYHQSA